MVDNSNGASISGATHGTSVTVVAASICNSSYTVHLHIQSSNGLVISDCDEIVSVGDGTNPELNIPADAQLTCGSATDTAHTGKATASDGCSGLKSLTYSDASVAANCTGNAGIDRTWRAEDNCGNISSSVQHITFIDLTAPSIDCPGNVQVQCGGRTDTAVTGKATATDNCNSAISITYSDEATAANCTGQAGIARTWKAQDGCGNFSTCVQYITYVDNTAPSITACAADTTIECDASTDPHVTGYPTANDNCSSVTLTWKDNSLTSSCVGTITRTWTAEDGCGNKSTCSQTLTLRDRTAPTITCPADKALGCGDSSAPSNTGTATATDNCSTVTIYYRDAAVTGSNCSGRSNIDRTWTAVDESGNISTCVQHITF